MRKLLIGGLAALTFGLTALPAPEAVARDRHYYRHRDRGDDALVAGIAGLAIGSALSNRSDRGGYYYQDRGYYRDSGYYGGSGYAYDPRYDSYYGSGYYAPPRRVYRTCTRTERFWDPYVGGYVRVKRRYAC